jgi:hypothetical protein
MIIYSAGFHRKSAASRGSTRGALSAHRKVDTGEDDFHLSRWDFADALGQLPFINGHKLLACLGNPDPGDMKVYCPTGKETFDDETTEEAPSRGGRCQAARC